MNTRIAGIICFFLVSIGSRGQSRISLSVGMGGSTAHSFYLATHSLLPVVEFEYERKIMGSFSLLTGLSTFGVNYSDHTEIAGSTSSFKARYLAVPVLARWNIRNKNSFYFDFGLQPYYMLDAHLEESLTRFGSTEMAQGNITGYSSRFFMSTRFQVTKAFNRISITFFQILSMDGQPSTRSLVDHWAFNQQQSPYLAENGYTDFNVTGFKLGVRIK